MTLPDKPATSSKTVVWSWVEIGAKLIALIAAAALGKEVVSGDITKITGELLVLIGSLGLGFISKLIATIGMRRAVGEVITEQKRLADNVRRQ